MSSGAMYFQVDPVNLCAPVDIVGHPGRGDQVIKRQGGVVPHLWVVPRSTGEPPVWGTPLPPEVDLFDLLHHLEEPGPA